MGGAPGTCWKSVPMASQADVMVEKFGMELALDESWASAGVSTAPTERRAAKAVFVFSMTLLFSELCFFRRRDLFRALAERIDRLAVGAAGFRHRPRDLAPAMDDVQRLLVHGRIFDGDIGLERLAALDEMIALHDVQLLRVGRTVIIDEGLRILADGVDHERVALIAADGFAVPGWRQIFRMGRVHVDVSHLLIHLPDHGDLLRRLEKEGRLRRIEVVSRDARHP